MEELLDGFVYAYMLATKLGMYQPDPRMGQASRAMPAHGCGRNAGVSQVRH